MVGPAAKPDSERTAACACGQLSLACRGEPEKVSLCHCDACKRRTGSAFGIAAFFERNRIRIAGEARRYTRPSDSGFSVTHHFCPDCGSTVFWEPARKPGMIAVAVGAFADRDFPAPSQAVYEASRYSWLDTI